MFWEITVEIPNSLDSIAFFSQCRKFASNERSKIIISLCETKSRQEITVSCYTNVGQYKILCLCKAEYFSQPQPFFQALYAILFPFRKYFLSFQNSICNLIFKFYYQAKFLSYQTSYEKNFQNRYFAL